MRPASVAVLAVAAAALLNVPADAASKKRSAYAQAQYGQVVRGQAVAVRNSRTRITVTRRSYLDPGSEIYPGSMSSRDYVFPPNTRDSTDLYLPGEAQKSSLPHPLWLRAYHSPSWGY